MKPGQAVALIAELIDAAKNWLAMDGLWFQAVERAFGMDTVLGMDRDVWEQFAVIEAMRIKERLTLPDKGGLDTIEIAFKNRLVFLLNDLEFFRSDEKILSLRQKHAGYRQPDRERDCHCFPANRSELSNFPYLTGLLILVK